MAEGFKLRLAIAVVVIFLISGWYSFQELRYTISGRTVAATVTNVEHRQERVYRRRFGHTMRDITAITVQFSNANNTPQTAVMTQSGVSAVQPQQQMQVQFIPGEYETVRLAGQQNWVAVLFFFGGLAAMAGTLVWVGMEANRPFGPSHIASDDRPVRAIVPKKKKRGLKPLKPAGDE